MSSCGSDMSSVYVAAATKYAHAPQVYYAFGEPRQVVRP